MWEAHVEELESDDGNRVQRVALTLGSKPLLVSDVVDRWQRDEGFRAYFHGLLAEAPFEAYLWETPPVTSSTVIRPFEFVLVESPVLASLSVDRESFREHFDAAGTAYAVTFWNLGRDALLVAPRPLSATSAYPHLAAFAREAPKAQQHALWRRVGEAYERRIGERPTWLSTNGLGVAWLHVRIDSTPKYYSHDPYTEAG